MHGGLTSVTQELPAKKGAIVDRFLGKVHKLFASLSFVRVRFIIFKIEFGKIVTEFFRVEVDFAALG